MTPADTKPPALPDMLWTDPPPCAPCEFRYKSDTHRDAAARLILSLYGARVCLEDPTQDDGLYRPHGLARRAITAWECRMAAAKYDRHRTAFERAVCAANLAAFEQHFGAWEEGADGPDPALNYILKLEGWLDLPLYDVSAAYARCQAETALEAMGYVFEIEPGPVRYAPHA